MTTTRVDPHTAAGGAGSAMNTRDRDALLRSIDERYGARAAAASKAFAQALANAHLAVRQARRAQALEEAAFRFEHAGELTKLAYLDPQRMLREAFGDLPPEFKFEWTPEQIKEAVFWEKFVERIKTPVRGLILGPVLYDGPLHVDVDSQITLLGARLGSAAGNAVLIDCNGVSHALPVVSWTQTAVQLTIPASIVGIPFDCAGQIELHLPGGQVAAVSVVVEPLSALMWSGDSFSASGYALLDEYAADHQFRSVALPLSFRQFMLPSGTDSVVSNSVLFRIWNNLLAAFDGGVHVSVTNGPVVDANRLVVSTHLTDDHAWSFTIRAEFYIAVPTGIAAPGWN